MESRVQKELVEIMKTGIGGFQKLNVDETKISEWEGLIVPEVLVKLLQDKSPYNKGAFKIGIRFPLEYPFKPPKITIKTKIYHPNIDEKGEVCLNIINPENWKPATKISQVLEALVNLVNNPEPDHPLRADLAAEFTNSHSTFVKKAEECTTKHAEKRPI